MRNLGGLMKFVLRIWQVDASLQSLVGPWVATSRHQPEIFLVLIK
jgi:hypothetical protein